jgi:hypothetical protein
MLVALPPGGEGPVATRDAGRRDHLAVGEGRLTVRGRRGVVDQLWTGVVRSACGIDEVISCRRWAPAPTLGSSLRASDAVRDSGGPQYS